MFWAHTSASCKCRAGSEFNQQGDSCLLEGSRPLKHSVVAMGALHERQRGMNIPQHSLLQDVATRWNSTYFMNEQLAEQRCAIYAVIHDEQVSPTDKRRHFDLRLDQRDPLSQLVTVLKPLQVVTTALS